MTQSEKNRKFCSQCGTPRRATAKVCSQCGHRFVEAIAEPPIVQSNAIAEPPIVKTKAMAEPPIQAKTIAEPPIVQSRAIAEPINQQKVTSTRKGQPKPVFDLSGEKSPYLSPEDLNRLRGVEPSRMDNFRKFIRSLLGY